MICSTVPASPSGSGSADTSATCSGTVGSMPRLSASAARASSTAPRARCSSKAARAFSWTASKSSGRVASPWLETRTDGPLDRCRRFERGALCGDLLAAGAEQEEALRDVEGDLLVLPVEAPVGAEELLARLLDRRVPAAEVEDQIAELSPGDGALALDR